MNNLSIYHSRLVSLFSTLTFLIAMSLSYNANATIINSPTLNGSVSAVSGVLASDLSVGDLFSSTFAYEDTTTDINSSASIGQYLAGLTSFNVVVGGFNWSIAAPGTVLVFDQPNNSRWTGALTAATTDSPSTIGSDVFMSIDFQSADSDLFTSDAINQSALLDPTQFTSTIQLRVIDNSLLAGFAILNINGTGSGSTIPEPASWILLMSGLVGLGFQKKLKG